MTVDISTLVLVTIATAIGLGVMSIALAFFQAGTRGMRHWGMGLIASLPEVRQPRDGDGAPSPVPGPLSLVPGPCRQGL